MDDFAFAFAELPASYFPFTITFYGEDDPSGLRPLYIIEVAGPRSIEIPALKAQTGQRVWVNIKFPDGHSVVSHPPAQ